MDRIISLVAIVALGAALTVSEFSRHANDRKARQREDALEMALAGTKADAQTALASVIAPSVVEDARKSVYILSQEHIDFAGSSFGTVFVVDQANGVLATAAHVIDDIDLNDKLKRFEIVNRETRRRLPVRAVRKHSGYGSFAEIVEAYQPINPRNNIERPSPVILRELPFDVGLVFVDPLDVETGEYVLGPSLPIASDETLAAMKAGEPIAVIGYPYDVLDSGLANDVAQSRFERGVVAALIAPVGSTQTPPNSAIDNLIVHRMATAGGNSGSPLLNRAGEVVGIHSHGYPSESSNGDGLGQRADALRDMLEPFREERRLTRLFKPAWMARLADWSKAEDVVPWSVYLWRTKQTNVDKIATGMFDFSTPKPFDNFYNVMSFSEPQRAYSMAAPDLGVAQPPDRGLSLERQPQFVIDSTRFFDGPAQYTEMRYFFDKKKDAAIYGFDYAIGAGYCPITMFWRPDRGETVYVNPASNSLPGGRNAVFWEAGDPKMPASVQVVFARAATCDRRNRKMVSGLLRWPPARTPDAAGPAETPDTINAETAVAGGGDNGPSNHPLWRGAHLAAATFSTLSAAVSDIAGWTPDLPARSTVPWRRKVSCALPARRALLAACSAPADLSLEFHHAKPAAAGLTPSAMGAGLVSGRAAAHRPATPLSVASPPVSDDGRSPAEPR